MAGMKPKILCGHCSAPLERENQFCSSCGVAVDWTEEITSDSLLNLRMESAKVELREKKLQPKEASNSRLFKLILSTIIVAAVAVIGYEFFIEKSQNAGSTQQVPVQPTTMTGEISHKQAEIQELEKDAALHPNDMTLTLQLANSLQDGIFYERAIPYYKIVLMKNPSNADARVDLGICYKELGNFSEAKKEMKEALKYVPKHLQANFNLGVVCLSEGNLHEANEWFQKTIALDSTSEIGKRAHQLLTQHNSPTSKTN